MNREKRNRNQIDLREGLLLLPADGLNHSSEEVPGQLVCASRKQRRLPTAATTLT